MNSFSPFCENDAAWRLLGSATAGPYLAASKPLGDFFEEEGDEEADEGGEGVEEGELEVVAGEIEDGEVGDPDEGGVEEGSEGVEDGRGQQVV